MTMIDGLLELSGYMLGKNAKEDLKKHWETYHDEYRILEILKIEAVRINRDLCTLRAYKNRIVREYMKKKQQDFFIIEPPPIDPA